MIISASRRTDIPAQYSNWFFRRMKEGYLYTRNPVNHHQVRRISLARDDLDGVVFWTKNPIPMANKLQSIQDIPFYFQFTLTAYGNDLEPGVPNKNDILIPAFQSLAHSIGPERIVWRYDPIVITQIYTPEYHIYYFEQIARRLSGCFDTCVISFFDHYRHLKKEISQFSLRAPNNEEVLLLSEAMADISLKYGFALTTCSEHWELSQFGISHGCCIDPDRLSVLGGIPLRREKDPNQRKDCLCAPSVDIGMYNCCKNGCKYCYANHHPSTVIKNIAQHNPLSPFLYGGLEQNDTITDCKIISLRDPQITLFE